MSDTPTPTKKWTLNIKPRQAKALAAQLSQLSAERRTFIERRGVHGGASDDATLVDLFGDDCNPEASATWTELGTAHGWTVTEATIDAVQRDLTIALARAIAGRPVVDERRTPEEVAARNVKQAADTAEREDKRAGEKAALAAILAKQPSGVTALIIAEYEEDKCDSGSDYYAVNTARRVAIGWRRGPREDFRQLRRAAATFRETAHLGPSAGSSIEHRDNYSMGAGNYLKDGGPYDSGWRVISRYHKHLDNYGLIEDKLLAPAPHANGGHDVGGASVRPSSRRTDFVELVFSDKPSEDVRGELKTAGFRWAPSSGCWYGPADRLPERYTWPDRSAVATQPVGPTLIDERIGR